MFSRNEIGNPAIRPTRDHYAYTELEEFHPDGGMWAVPAASDRQHYIEASAELMVNVDAFTSAMRRALTEWPKSSDAALSNPGMNHRAWLGHAGCYLATGSPEEVTRLGWHTLDATEQWAANEAASRVITEWRNARKTINDRQLEMWTNA